MLKRCFPTVLATVVMISGCAIRPEPKNYSRVSTFQIVRQILCETRSAAITLALAYADHSGGENRKVARRFEGIEPANIIIDPDMFHDEVRDNIALFWSSGVAYNFNLEMTEINNLGSDLNFIRRLTYRTFDLGIKAGLDRQRQNTRSFTVTNRIGDLVHDVYGKDIGCDADVPGPNYIYPIAGEIGVKPMLESFVYMTLFNNLGGFQDKVDPTKLGGPPTMVDSLEFQTKIYGDVTPKVSFSPVGESFDLMNASLTSSNSRTDKHRVVMGIAIAGLPDGRLKEARGAFVGRFVTSSGGSSGAVAAARAVDQVITENALSRVTLVEQ